MLFGVLGPLQVGDDDDPDSVRIHGAVQRRLFTALLARPGEAVPVDSLLAAVWGDEPPATAERTLQSHVARLREALGREETGARLTLSVGGYRFDVGPQEVDDARFADAVGRARAAAEKDPADALLIVDRALMLWRGQPFADLADTDYPFPQAARLEELRRGALVDHAEYLLAVGSSAEAVAELEGLVSQHQFLERAWELLMVGLYRLGRQADALAAYQRARSALDDELGVEPGPRLRALEAQVLAQDPALLGRLPTGPVARTPCPYKGLTRYDVSDSEFFVGRERLAEELVAALVDRRLVVVVGPSGAGKSSVVRAGLLARLAEGAIPGSDGWRVRVVVPLQEPFARLQEALADGPDLLVVDQAETAWTDEVPIAERTAVADLIVQPDGATRVVLVLRADFYGRLSEHPTLARLAGPSTVIIGPPSEEDLRRIVTEPARLAGLSVDSAVADEIVRTISGHAGVLPVVSTALVRLWEHREGDRLTMAGYRASGGVEGALERAGEDAWADLVDDDQRAAARRMLVRLARQQDDRWIARRLPRDEVVTPGDTAAEVAADVLCDRRLLVAHADSLEVAHEALFGGWPRLSGWLADAASSRRELERLASAAHDWAAEDRDAALLLRGSRLVAATDLAQARPEDLSGLEHDYVSASVAAAERDAAAERERTRAALRSRRRTRVIAVALAVALLASLSAGVVAVKQARSANAAAVAANAGRIGALAKDPAVPIDQALLLGAQAEALHPGATEDSNLLAALARSPALAAAGRAPSRVLGLSVTPDGSHVLTAGVQGEVITWDAATLGQVSTTTGDPASSVAAGPDGTVVIGRQTKHVGVQFVAPDGSLITQVRVPNGPYAPVVATEGEWTAFVAASTETSDDVELVKTSDPTTVVATTRVPGHVVSLLPCGPTAFCLVTEGGELRTVSAPGGRLGAPIDTRSGLGAGSALPAQAFPATGSPDGREVAIGAGVNGLVQVRALPSGRLVRTLAATPFNGLPLAFSPDGRELAVSAYSTVQVWDLGSGQLLHSFEGHTGGVKSGAWSPDGHRLYTAGLDRLVLGWDLAGESSFVRTASLADPAEVGTAWAVGDTVVVGMSDGHLNFVRRTDGSVVRSAESVGKGWVETVRTGGSGTLAAVATEDGTLTVWDVPARRLLGTVDLPPKDDTVDPQAWVAPDGVTAATLHYLEGPLFLVDLPTRSVRSVTLHPPADTHPLSVLGWSADGHVLLALGSLEMGVDGQPVDGSYLVDSVLVVDPATGDGRVVRLEGELSEVAADPHGEWLAGAGQDGKLRFVSLADGHLLAPPQIAVDGQVYNVSVSPDGAYVATGGAPGQVKLWDTTTFRQVGPALPGPAGAATARVRFAPDGSVVAVYTPDSSALSMDEPLDATSGGDLRHGPVVWEYPVGREAWEARVCSTVGRGLTQEEWNTFLPAVAYDPVCS